MSSHQLAYASFTISGDEVIPEFWTTYFGVVPDTAVTKGEPFTTPAGKISRVPGRTGVWGVRSKATVQSDRLEPHLRYLIERLALPRADLRERVERAGARMRFFCYWDNESGDRIPDVPDDIRTMMESLGGTIEVDEYR
ncbi:MULTISPECIES: DUF4279 domain-containing protein [Burkholderia]|uniref:DUF4279 domain-containing protein n=1 Tax=Burkholderia TaxID=32008 RepID=UPI0005BA628D|nr:MULTISPECIES: DUF4279 domain-containing protein [Burkholderia]MBJ9624007.1 DUF4279 domain-containing protein [Burkholderia multivorans]MBJ9656890.1 DUF4279 domain-containing protein [Burkholderia multivorans]MBJ9682871.1 DUF4279 domain-containing protein [Burkholderia multivorans]MBU9472475.1 DUF4279 domain-containing protein [Burkholderia multivorans]OFT87513.1 hypothetical protein HMPREF3115_15510 [Burkholderia sp. HMSC10F09]